MVTHYSVLRWSHGEQNSRSGETEHEEVLMTMTLHWGCLVTSVVLLALWSKVYAAWPKMAKRLTSEGPYSLRKEKDNNQVWLQTTFNKESSALIILLRVACSKK